MHLSLQHKSNGVFGRNTLHWCGSSNQAYSTFCIISLLSTFAPNITKYTLTLSLNSSQARRFGSHFSTDILLQCPSLAGL